MSARGEVARQEIITEAARIASVEGLEGLTLGVLAKHLQRSKSGLFAHFDSKEALQIAVLRHTEAIMTERVVLPALREPRGLPRVRALFKNWGRWAREQTALPGGCVFVNSSTEFDDKPGPVRVELVRSQSLWRQTLVRAFEIAKAEGQLKDGADPAQLAFEMYSLMLGSYLYFRLLDDPGTIEHVRRGFERLLASAVTGASPSL
jgi:AcrR family transcriptional regulator